MEIKAPKEGESCRIDHFSGFTANPAFDVEVCVCVCECSELTVSTSVCSGNLYSHQSESPGCRHDPTDCSGFVFILDPNVVPVSVFLSSSLSAPSGVPQGSTLGPLLVRYSAVIKLWVVLRVNDSWRKNLCTTTCRSCHSVWLETLKYRGIYSLRQVRFHYSRSVCAFRITLAESFIGVGGQTLPDVRSLNSKRFRSSESLE